MRNAECGIEVRINNFQRSSGSHGLFASIRANSRLILRVFSVAAFVVVLLLSPGLGSAQESSLDDVLGGFDDSKAVSKPEPPTEPAQASKVDLNGSVALSLTSNIHQHQSSSGTDYSGLSRLRFTLDLNLDAKLSKSWDVNVRGRGFYDGAYSINGRDHYTDQVISSLESEAELREAFIRGKVLPSLDVKLGRQIVVWGKSDNLRVTDVLNPLDNREPGMVDIEDLRLPLTMARADWYAGKWNVTAIAIPEIRFNKNPVYGSDFYPSTQTPQEVIPDDGGSNTEYAVALNGILTGWDISFYLARIFDDRPSARFIPPGPPVFEFVHNRVTMAGTAVNVALGNWLLKSEGAYFSGLQFYALPYRTFERADVLLGVEYTGFNETTVSLEAVNRHLLDYDEAISTAPDSTRQDEVQTAFRFQRDFLNDRVHLMLLALTSGWNGRDGKVQRLQVEYELTDAVALTGGVVNYGSGNRTEFRNIGKNDRVFLEVKYSF
ncbi:MAG: hypothetical protein A2X56_02675 [Nitrospirae bacterium GWC2_57_13]|jgi:hypothetical protein|nr:MAG: hypothetical protein A2072_02075 [Nitrospirae bacterium GWC1_57_7]OGW28602.1 MAG: hypothetical protein A2X56_02675 [Nitrospirae bacterium GWC2_57_13]